jgi:multisubunit Na+/H+ antiporter MnhG subunit
MKPMDRITVIRQSLSVFVCGIAGLLPFVGVVPAASALVGAVRIHRGYHDFNPAGNYAKWGVRLALLGFIITFIAAVMVGFHIVSQAEHPDYGGYE